MLVLIEIDFEVLISLPDRTDDIVEGIAPRTTSQFEWTRSAPLDSGRFHSHFT